MRKKENVSATVEAYYALLYSGYYKESDPTDLRQLRRSILAGGGKFKQVKYVAPKFMLAANGSDESGLSFFPLPVEMILLPASFPLTHLQFFCIWQGKPRSNHDFGGAEIAI